MKHGDLTRYTGIEYDTGVQGIITRAKEAAVDITVYLPDELGARAKEADLPFSRLLRAAVEEELERRAVVARTLENSETFELSLEDQDGRAYTGRLVGQRIAADNYVDVYLTEDERVLVHDEKRAQVHEVGDPEEELRDRLGPGWYAAAMHALGLRPVVDL